MGWSQFGEQRRNGRRAGRSRPSRETVRDVGDGRREDERGMEGVEQQDVIDDEQLLTQIGIRVADNSPCLISYRHSTSSDIVQCTHSHSPEPDQHQPYAFTHEGTYICLPP